MVTFVTYRYYVVVEVSWVLLVVKNLNEKRRKGAYFRFFYVDNLVVSYSND